MRSVTCQSGVTMIEVLVTIVIISFGFLSLLNMQLSMLTSSSATSQSFLASSLAHEMAERVRANQQGRDDYNGFKTSEFDLDCSQVVCTVAQQDFFDWKNNIEAGGQGISAGQGEVSVVGEMVTISLTWSEKIAGHFEKPSSYSLEVQVEDMGAP
jgi:type IV pilus assembly protein PilV